MVDKKAPTQFKKGESGNLRGRPRGSQNRSTLIKAAIEKKLVGRLERDAVDIMDKAITMAKDGDQHMLKLLIERLLPARKPAEDGELRGNVGIQIVVNGMEGKEPVTINQDE